MCATACLLSASVWAADNDAPDGGDGATMMAAPSKGATPSTAGKPPAAPSPTLSREVADACMKASNLRRPRALGRVIAFNDQVGMLAVLIEGTAPGAHRSAPRTELLCLFDKVTRKPFFAEAGPLLPRAR